MFIIEKPYVSEYLIDTIINNNWPVLDNQTIDECGMEEGAFNLWSSERAKDNYLKQEYPLIYSNSENAIVWILENLPQSNISTYIKLFKDKIAFREKLKELYPDFYFESFNYEDVNYIEKEKFKFPLVFKPSVGFLNTGVRVINNVSEWDDAVKSLNKELSQLTSQYEQSVFNSSKILLEEFIEGEEFAIDAYYDRNGSPVILNIFKHMQNNKNIKDRLYITSTSIMVEHMAKFAQLLRDLGKLANIKNLPINLEVKINSNEEIIPIEVNPIRFANWCSADIAKYAWGINVYEYFNNQTCPDWNSILANSGKEIYYYALFEVPKDYPKNSISSFNFNACLAYLSNVIELRRVNYKANQLFGVVFGKTENEDELKIILALDTNKYIIN